MYRTTRTLTFVLTFCTAALLVSCGGGGGGGGTPTQPPTTTYSEHLYIGNAFDTNISQYTINQTTGALEPKTPAQVDTLEGQNWIAISPDGNYAYVTRPGTTDEVTLFNIEDDGSLTLVQSYATGNDPWGVALNAAGTFLYVANSSDATITQFEVSATDGTLTLNGTAPAATPALVQPQVIAISDNYLYVTDFVSDTVVQYVIQGNGTLVFNSTRTSTITSPISSPLNMAIERTGSYLYVANIGSDNVSVFGIDPGTGALSALGSNDSGTGPGADLSSLVIDPSGENLYTTNNFDETISHFSIGSDGLLTRVGTDINSTSPYAIAINPNGGYLYATDDLNDEVIAFEIGASGALISPQTPVSAISAPWSIATVGITR